MGIMDAQLLTGKVMHKRLLPKKNGFQYGIYYLALPLSQLKKMPLAYNKFAPLSFFDKDHGPCDGNSLDNWAREILREHKVTADGEITLICMPRVLGYAFNPVSFWLCRDKLGQIRAVLCEVHNTFGERHTYMCAHEDRRPVNALSLLFAQKLFHVSPFLAREGHYEFKFDVHDDVFNVVINLHHEEGDIQLITALTGKLQALTKASLRYAFWHYPLVTLKAIVMIHWQALKLVSKGIKYIPKPEQKPKKISATN